MEADQARNIARQIISSRKAEEKNSRSSIETNMSEVYEFIESCAREGKFSCGFPLSNISAKAEDELRTKRYNVTIQSGVHGKYLSVDWLGL